MPLVSPLFSLSSLWFSLAPLFSLLSLSSLFFLCVYTKPSQTHTKSVRHIHRFWLMNPSNSSLVQNQTTSLPHRHCQFVTNPPIQTNLAHHWFRHICTVHPNPFWNQLLYPIFQTLIAKLKTPNIPFYQPKSKSKSLNPYSQQKTQSLN